MRPGIELNWLARYLPLQSVLDEQARRSLLEVGSGHVGLGCIVESPFVGVDISFPLPPQSPMLPFAYDGERLPFAAASFDTVVSMDTFEHVPPSKRKHFLEELLRVAASKVVISFPADQQGRDADAVMQRTIMSAGLGSPRWLHEHEEHGIPKSAEWEPILNGLAGWTWQSLPTTGSLACVLMTLADVMPTLRPWAQSLLRETPEALTQWISMGSFGPAFRKLYVLERVEAVRAQVELSDLRTLLPAVMCPQCDQTQTVKQSESGLTCSACGAAFAMDVRGVVQIEKPLPKKVTFYLEPDWLGSTDWVSAIHNFLKAFEPNDACRLWLQVDPKRLPLQVAATMLEPLHASFGAREFAELVLSDDVREPPPVSERIALSQEGLSVDAFRAQLKAHTVEHAP
jgi:ribosomal protein S27E